RATLVFPGVADERGLTHRGASGESLVAALGSSADLASNLRFELFRRGAPVLRVVDDQQVLRVALLESAASVHQRDETLAALDDAALLQARREAEAAQQVVDAAVEAVDRVRGRRRRQKPLVAGDDAVRVAVGVLTQLEDV